MNLSGLETIEGIEPQFRLMLKNVGIHTIADLARTTPEQLADLIPTERWRRPNYAHWISQAQQCLATSPDIPASLMNEPAKIGPSTPTAPSDTEVSPAASVAPEAETTLPEIHDPDTGSMPATIAVGPVDATFAAADDGFATAPDPDLNESTGVIEPSVGEMGTDFSAPEEEPAVEGVTNPPPPALITPPPPADFPAPGTEATIPEIHDPDTDSTPATIAVGPVDATFAAADDGFATAPDPDLNESTGVIEPTVGEMGTDFSAPEKETEAEGVTNPPAPALITPPPPAAPPADFPAPEAEATIPEIHDPDTDSTPATIAVGPVDATFAAADDGFATAPDPDLNESTGVIEPTVGEMGTDFSAPEAETEVEGAAKPPPPALITPPPAADFPAPEAETTLPEIHDPDTDSTPATIAVGPVDATFAATDDGFATAPDPDLSESTGIIEPSVGEMGTDFSAPEEEAAVEDVTTPPPPASIPAPPLPPTPTHPASKLRGCLRQLGLLLLTALLGAFLALLVIYLINGTLNFGRHEAIIALHSDVDTLSTQVQQQNTAVSDLNSAVQDTTTQMDELAVQVQTIDQHLNILADDLNAMRDDLVTLAEQNAAIQQQLTVIDTQIERLNRTAERFDTFAAGLKELADAIQPQAIFTPTATITPTQPITSTAPITTATPVPDISTESIPNAVSGSLALQIFPSRTAIFTPTPGKSLILGLVWDDLNGNGRPEANEIPLPAVRIILKNIQGETIAKTDTTGDGRYTFPELTPGVYVLTEFDPPGTTSITANSVTVTTVANSIVEINFADTHLP